MLISRMLLFLVNVLQAFLAELIWVFSILFSITNSFVHKNTKEYKKEKYILMEKEKKMEKERNQL